MLAALAASLLIQASPAAPEPLEALARSRLTSAYVVGMCEAYARPEAGRRVLEAFATPEAPDRAALWAAYHGGQKDPRRPDLTADLCADLFREASDRLGQALARVRAIEATEP